MSPSFVYIYLDPRTPGNFQYQKWSFDHLPLYVGRGIGKRHLSHWNLIHKPGRSRNPLFKRTLQQINKLTMQPIIRMIQEGLEFEESCILERHLIKLIGRKIYGEGPLLNITEGGESSRLGRKSPMSTRRKISIANTGRVISEEHRRKISVSHKGKPLSQEHRLRIGKASKGPSRETTLKIIESRLKKRPSKELMQEVCSRHKVARNAAKELGISTPTLRKLLREHELPKFYEQHIGNNQYKKII